MGSSYLPDWAHCCYAFTSHCCSTPLPCPQICCHFQSKACSFLHALFKIIPAYPSPQLYLPEELFILQDSAQMPHHLLWLNLLPKNFLFCTRIAPIDFLVVILITFHYGGSSISPLASHLLNSSNMFMLYCAPNCNSVSGIIEQCSTNVKKMVKITPVKTLFVWKTLFVSQKELNEILQFRVSFPTVKFWIKNKSPEIAL